jgi:hypothetical protein
MDRIGPWDVVGHQQVLRGVHDNTQVSMSTTSASRGNAAGVVVELLLEHLEPHVGGFTNDLGELPLREQKESESEISTPIANYNKIVHNV